ncbi:MAG: hypothetical protein FWD57_16155 [Polyangiaceae bacterium]|nr:hypothetical protein [Polyangiaceae bacterium]
MKSSIDSQALSMGFALLCVVSATMDMGCSTSDSRKSAATDGDSGTKCDGSCGGSGGAIEGGYGGSGGTGGKECSPKPIPDTVPLGWEEFPVMDCKYRIYVPSSREYLPPPLVWEPCSSKTGPLAFDCRQIKMDWPSTQPQPYSLGQTQFGYVGVDGKAVLQVHKVYEQSEPELSSGVMGMVADADGPVRQAFWRDYSAKEADFASSISFWPTSVAHEKSSWFMVEYADGQTRRLVSFVGDDASLCPRIMNDKLLSESLAGIVWVGSLYYAEAAFGQGWVRKWDGTDLGVAVPDTWAYSTPQWIGRNLLFALEANPSYRVKIWTEQNGTQTLVGHSDDDSVGWANPGSDGKDLVWIQGEGRKPDDEYFPTRWIMTSKFSTDPAEIKPKRLIPWPTRSIGAQTASPAVGCGYAAFQYDIGWPSSTEMGIIVVRLSDGQSWVLVSPSLVPRDSWTYPIAITCEEVFATYSAAHMYTIRRVRLDSLGPGTPPPK